MRCLNCDIHHEMLTDVKTGLCEKCFVEIICEESKKEACAYKECEFHEECQTENE